MIEKVSFLTKYNIDTASFEATGLAWEDLLGIHSDYSAFKEELEPSAIFAFNRIMKFPNVHSVRYRIKNPEHLVEKIIRKKIEDNSSNITIDNYRTEVTDLIGLRALHLFKEDWESIHKKIMETWSLKQNPIANYRKGDSDEIIQIFRENDCEPKEHKYGYRSVHYLIETQPAKTKYYAEIQVRTIYEEAWSEVDHTIRYPYDLENPIFFQFLSILNRLSGGADEMSSFVKFLKGQLIKRESEFSEQIDSKNKIIDDLERKISQFNLKEEEKASVKEDLEKLKTTERSPANLMRASSGIEAILRQQKSMESMLGLPNLITKMQEINRTADLASKIQRATNPFGI